MKFPVLLSAVALAGHAHAFYGKMTASDYESSVPKGGTGVSEVLQYITLTDLNTGSMYEGVLEGGFDGCTSEECSIYFVETTTGDYNFYALMWRTSDGCHNIDFEGAFSAGHGYCCGSLPCDFSA
ncbi:hypothetical protein N7466_007322 [Penicillium verhagenii]|uniref:uncharacterized protein n=1 Tax=Penicillium verhagenii TaxID=1562060 RepID=UPI0025454B25|nr:uncharacterized protein N7466_007322 [Penicillium verhagenii]KAJ5928366.1 hypothetical protein N7466_007322 [Penicillium verhagenii]